MKVLAIRLDAAGDVLMCTPALAALAAHGHDVTLLTSVAGAQTGQRLDMVRETLVLAVPWMKASPQCSPPRVLKMAAILTERRFDIAVIFTSYTQSPLPAAMLCHLAGIPRCVAHCRENPYQLLSDWVKEPEPERLIRHEVKRQLDLVAHIGCPSRHALADERLRYRITRDDLEACHRLLQQAGMSEDEPFLLLHPGATAASRRYPEKQWSEVIARLIHATDRRLVIAGGIEDIDLTERLCAETEASCVNVAGQLDFGKLAALIASASLLISNNSAPAHLAAASATPVVVLYALTNPQHTPWQVPNRVLFHPVSCHTCYQSVCPQLHHPCLTGVTPEQVVSAVISLLNETSLTEYHASSSVISDDAQKITHPTG